MYYNGEQCPLLNDEQFEGVSAVTAGEHFFEKKSLRSTLMQLYISSDISNWSRSTGNIHQEKVILIIDPMV